jgi:hypothetical protein
MTTIGYDTLTVDLIRRRRAACEQYIRALLLGRYALTDSDLSSSLVSVLTTAQFA